MKISTSLSAGLLKQGRMTQRKLAGILLPVITSLSLSQLNAATTLSIGDILIASANSDTPDGFTFVLLKDLDSSTVIKFTDNGFKSSGSAIASNNIRGSENFVVWTTDAALSAGSVIRTVHSSGSVTTVTGGGSASGALSGLSSGGDQIFAYQGTGAGSNISGTTTTETFSGSILYGVNVANSGWITTGGDSANLSYLPSQLNVTDANIALEASPDYAYTAARAGLTTAVYRAALANTDNWTGYAANQTQLTINFTIGTSATLTWDAINNGKAVGTGGSGTWDTTTQSRFSNSGNDTFVHWVNSVTGSNHSAVLGGAVGTSLVSVASGGVTVSGLTFGVSGYNIQNNTVTLLGSSTPSLSVTSAGHTATISGSLAGLGGFTKSGSGDLTLTGDNSILGAVSVTAGKLTTNGTGTNKALGVATSVSIIGGTLLLGASDQINNSATLAFGGGKLDLNGSSETMISLTLSAESRIDFGGGDSVLRFGISTQTSGFNGGLLYIDNHNGAYSLFSTTTNGGSTEALYFGTNNSGISDQLLGQIRFVNPNGISGIYTAVRGGDGVVFASVPEATTIIAALALLGLVGYRERRRFFGRAKAGLPADLASAVRLAAGQEVAPRAMRPPVPKAHLFGVARCA